MLPRAVVAKFQISARAETDLIAIYDDSEARFGHYQADDLKAGYRRFRFQAHIIFYSETVDGVLIHALVHSARDIRPELFE